MKKEIKVLILIFFLVFAFRLFFVFQTPHFSSDHSYFNVRHADYVSEHFKPLFHDPLSYGGRTIINSPIFHYLLASFNIILPSLLTYKIIPALLISSLVFIVFGIAFRITNNSKASLLAAFISGFIPIVISSTLNQVSPYSLVIPLIFYGVYCLLNLETHINHFLVISFLLPLIHPISFIFSISLLLYIILLSIDSIKSSKLAKEAVVFSIFINILTNFIIYKKAFLQYGLKTIWQNVPTALILDYFKGITILDIITGIGVIPLLFGVIGFTVGMFKGKRHHIYLLSAMILADLLLLLLRLINFSVGLMFLGILLSIISAISFQSFSDYISMTKFSKYKPHLKLAFILILMFSIAIPSYSNASKTIGATISEDEVNTLKWISMETRPKSVVLSRVEEGNYITAIAKRKNVADTYFLMAPDLYSDISLIFKTQSLVQATQLLKKYNVDYIYFSDKTKELYNLSHLSYTIDGSCFKQVYGTDKSYVYAVLC